MNKPISAKVKVESLDTNPVRDLPIMQLMCNFCDPSFNPSKVILQKSLFLCHFEMFYPKWPWRSRSNPTIYNPIHDLPMIHLMAKFGDPTFNPSKVIVQTSPFLANFYTFDPKWPWRSRSNPIIYNPIQDLHMMHLMAKFGDPSFNPSRVIVRTSPFLADFDSFDPKWPWRSRSNPTIYIHIRDLPMMHLIP